MSETDIQRLILEFLKVNNIPAWRNNTGRRGSVAYGLCKGSSDIIGIFNGRFLAIEVKVPGQKPEPKQQEFLDTVNKAGGIGFCAHSIDEVREFLLKAAHDVK